MRFPNLIFDMHVDMRATETRLNEERSWIKYLMRKVVSSMKVTAFRESNRNDETSLFE